SLDQEIALAQGVNVGRVFSIAWAIGGGLAALGGVLLAANGGVVQATDALFSLVVLPAIIIGGIDSLKGAIIGGLVVGLVASLTSAYQPTYAPWLGPNFENVAPYLVMIIVLLARPYGIFGTREVQRLSPTPPHAPRPTAAGRATRPAGSRASRRGSRTAANSTPARSAVAPRAGRAAAGRGCSRATRPSTPSSIPGTS